MGRRRPSGAGRTRLLVAGAVLILAVAVVVAATSGGKPPPLPRASSAPPAGSGDPFAYLPSHASEFGARAIAGEGHVLFEKSPGGAVATARRVAAYGSAIEAAAAGSGIDPATLEGIVYLESAGAPTRSPAVTRRAPSGSRQIEAATGQSLLGMHIDLASSRRLTAQIGRVDSLGQPRALARLERARVRADDRFDPRKALAATIRYLRLAEQHFGRLDLAIESYHMGIGNLASVLDAYDGGSPVPYVQLYFDTSPDRHGAAYRLLSSFGDDSWTYYWRVLAAEQIMDLYRTDPAALRKLSTLETDAGSAEVVLHPPDRTPVLSDPDALATAYADRQLVRLPVNGTSLGLAYDPSMGSFRRGSACPERCTGDCSRSRSGC